MVSGNSCIGITLTTVLQLYCLQKDVEKICDSKKTSNLRSLSCTENVVKKNKTFIKETKATGIKQIGLPKRHSEGNSLLSSHILRTIPFINISWRC